MKPHHLASVSIKSTYHLVVLSKFSGHYPLPKFLDYHHPSLLALTSLVQVEKSTYPLSNFFETQQTSIKSCLCLCPQTNIISKTSKIHLCLHHLGLSIKILPFLNIQKSKIKLCYQTIPRSTPIITINQHHLSKIFTNVPFVCHFINQKFKSKHHHTFIT